MRRRDLLLSSLAPASALLSCSRLRHRAPLATVRVATAPLLAMSPFYMGYESGYYREAGLNLELMKDLPNAQSVSLLAGGKVDAAFPGLAMALPNAVLRGARVRIVAAREICAPGCNLHGRIFVDGRKFPNGVQDMRQLRGHRIAVSLAAIFGQFTLDKLLEHAGMSRADVEIRQMGPNERYAALRSGGVDALVSLSADLHPVLGGLKILPGPSLSDILPNFQYGFILFGSHLLDSDVAVGASFLRAYFHGARDYLGGKTPRFVDDFARSNGLDPAVVRAGCRDSFEHDGRIRLNDLQTLLDWALSRGYLEHRMDAQSLVDTRFLHAAQRTS